MFMLTGKPALLINEMQKFVVDPAYAGFPALAKQVVERRIAEKISALAAAFRKAGAPIFHAPVRGRPDRIDVKGNSLITALSLKGTPIPADDPRLDYVAGCEAHEGDIEIIRTSGIIAMYGTPIDAMMRRMGVETVVVVGVSTNVGVPGNVIMAEEMGYHVVVPEDCIAGTDPDTHRIILEGQIKMLARIVQSEDIIAALAG